MCGPFSALNPDRLTSLREEVRGFMKVPQRLDDLLAHALRVQCFGYGEPTLHPDFVKFLDLCADYETMVTFFTNGMHFTPALIANVISARAREVTISFSGATKEHYEAVYIGGRWETVLSGIRALADAKGKNAYPTISINSIGFRHHVERFPDFVDIMGEAGANVIYLKPLIDTVTSLKGYAAIYRPQVEGEILAEARRRAEQYSMLISAEGFERNISDGDALPNAQPTIEDLATLARVAVPNRPLPYQVGNRPAPDSNPLSADELSASGIVCLEPFSTFYVGRNLEMKPCCNSAFPTGLGNLKMERTETIWDGPKLNKVRNHLINGRYPSLCHECVKSGGAYQNANLMHLVGDYGAWFTSSFEQDFNLPEHTLEDLNRPNSEIAALHANGERHQLW